MSLSHLNKRHLSLITSYAGRHAVRGGAGLVYLLLTIFFGLIIAQMILSPVQMIIKESKEETGGAVTTEQVMGQILDFSTPFVEWSLGGGGDDEDVDEDDRKHVQDWTNYLLHERPALLSAIFLILLFGMPFIIPFGAFNQLSGDIGNRGLRYLLLRTERANLFFGRFMAMVLFTIVVQLFTVLTITLYLGLKFDLYGATDLATWAGIGFVAFVFLSLPYIALCTAISGMNDSPMLCLVFCKLVIGGVLLAAFLLAKKWEAAAYIKWLLPWGIQTQLLGASFASVAVACLACVGYTAVFLSIGYWYFAKRDL